MTWAALAITVLATCDFWHVGEAPRKEVQDAAIQVAPGVWHVRQVGYCKPAAGAKQTVEQVRQAKPELTSDDLVDRPIPKEGPIHIFLGDKISALAAKEKSGGK